MKRERSIPTLATLLAILTTGCGSLLSLVKGDETQTRRDAYRAELKRAQTRADEIKLKIEELEGYERAKLEYERAKRARRLVREAGLRWVMVPGGSFMMGSNDGDDDEKPIHRVSMSTFWIAESEVTVRQYRECVEAGVCTEPDTGDKCTWGKSGYDDHPINCVDWGQARTFSRWVGGDLPTEAQWEYAARGGKDFKYSGSDDASAVGWYEEETHPVKQKQKNDYRLYDMSGNVWEWTLDEWHSSYSGAPSSGDQPWGSRPVCSTRCDNGVSKRVNRGGGSNTIRDSDPPNGRVYGLGFRPARPTPLRPIPQSLGLTLKAYRAQKRERVERLVSEVDIRWVTVPGGSFMMGSNDGDNNEKPVRQVRVSAFRIAESEVTVRQYRKCVEAGVCTEPNTDAYCTWGKSGYDDHPINCVDWGQARTFSRWVGGDLPTEAQWEYAARGDQDFKYSGSDDASAVGWYDSNASSSTHPVKQKQKNGYGLYDMSGNVWEWTLDAWHSSYRWAPSSGDQPWGLAPICSAKCDKGSSRRVYRGGAWNYGARYLRVANRYDYTPSSRVSSLGFRPVRPTP